MPNAEGRYPVHLGKGEAVNVKPVNIIPVYKPQTMLVLAYAYHTSEFISNNMGYAPIFADEVPPFSLFFFDNFFSRVSHLFFCSS